MSFDVYKFITAQATPYAEAMALGFNQHVRKSTANGPGKLSLRGYEAGLELGQLADEKGAYMLHEIAEEEPYRTYLVKWPSGADTGWRFTEDAGGHSYSVWRSDDAVPAFAFGMRTMAYAYLRLGLVEQKNNLNRFLS